jgi:two-component system sensor histidine kinase/response regulator
VTFPGIRGLEIQSGLARVAGDCRLYKGLLLNLARHWEHTLSDFETAWRNQDAARLQLLAHKLKGVAGNLGAFDLQDWAGRLEATARQPLSEAAQDSQAGLSACLQNLSQEILEQLQDWPGTQIDLSSQSKDFDQKLGQLLVELENFDGAALMTWYELAVPLQVRLSAENIALVDNLIHNFDFASARQTLQASLT